jgi:hypothetical protein
MYRANSLAILRVLKVWILSPVLMVYLVVIILVSYMVFKQGGGIPALWLLFLALKIIICHEIVRHLAMS